jgi:hypothetical protein
VQGQDRSGYFVRLGTATATPEAPPTRFADDEHSSPPHKRRSRSQFKLRPLTIIGLVIVGWLVWAATTPGGVSARLESISDRIEGLVTDATTDPGLKRAANFYNEQYAREREYPQMSEADLRDDPDAGWGVGVTTKWCNKHAMVLESLTGSGTISRLLLNGEDYGDVHGKADCPTDLSNPLPWKAE